MLRPTLHRLRWAVYGGAFDPPTVGHVACLRQMLDSGVEKVLVVPSGDREDKPGLSGKLDRLVMAEMMVSEAFPRRVDVSRVEYVKEGTLATYDLLNILKAEHPGIEFTFVIGSDWLSPTTNIADWTSAEGRTGPLLLSENHFSIIPRPGAPIPPSIHPNFSVLGSIDRSIDISSTHVRRLVCEGDYKAAASYVPVTVLNFLKRRQLYV